MSSPAHTRCICYHRTSLADGGEGPAAGLERCRRHARLKGLEIAAALSDSRKRPHYSRPGWARLLALLEQGAATVVIVPALHRLWPDTRTAVRKWHDWLNRGIDLVALDDLVDTTQPTDRVAMRATLTLLASMDRKRHAEATSCGLIVAAMRRKGLWSPGRETLIVDPLEIITLAHQGLSYRRMVAAIVSRGGRISYGTLAKHYHRLVAAGRIDLDKRAKAQLEAPPDRGGRPPNKPSGAAG